MKLQYLPGISNILYVLDNYLILEKLGDYIPLSPAFVMEPWTEGSSGCTCSLVRDLFKKRPVKTAKIRWKTSSFCHISTQIYTSYEALLVLSTFNSSLSRGSVFIDAYLLPRCLLDFTFHRYLLFRESQNLHIKTNKNNLSQTTCIW